MGLGEEGNMSECVFALLVADHSELFEPLRRTLTDLSIETYSVATCKEAGDLIPQCKPHIIFTESSLRDGWWSSILNIADAANVPISVIVVSEHPDTRLYLSAMERGAFDFVVPPFEKEPLNFVIRSAALHVQRRREAMAHAPLA
jgi:DNA-binding NtrC family response regulator